MSLPIDEVLPEIHQALTARDEAIVVAEPGAGKTTRIPLFLLDEPWLAGQQILLLEPRRIAARLAAQRMADLLGESVGETVGYRMRLESRSSDKTRVLVVTEGVLTRMLQTDPSLEGVGLVIFDEFHERSVDADLGLALTRYARELFRDERPLKILVMSATLDSDALSIALNRAPVVRSRGRSYPVEILHRERVERRELVSAVSRCVLDCLREYDGSILVFLPGQGEILAVERILLDATAGGDVSIAPLYGALPLERQRAAIQPALDGRRKVVLATDIAESSLTIEGIAVVIDSGWARKPTFDARLGMTRLATRRISQASAKQRAGRAGRLGPGVAVRLWSVDQERDLPPFSSAEISDTDLAPLALQLMQWGVDVDELDWLDKPSVSAWQQAQNLLTELGACDKNGLITEHGKAMAALPAHPRLAHMLLRAESLGLVTIASEIAALLSERDPAPTLGADLCQRLPLNRVRNTATRQQLQQQARQFQQLLGSVTSMPEARVSSQESIGLCVALAYPERIAMQRQPGGTAYQLANGRGAMLAEDDSLRREPLLAVAHLGGRAGVANDRIFLAAPLGPQLFGEVLPPLATRDIVEWQDNGQLLIERQHVLGKLVFHRETLNKVDEVLLKQALIQWIAERGVEALPWREQDRNLRLRVACLRELDGSESEWPDLSDDWLSQNLERWLEPYLPVIRNIRQLQSLDLGAALLALLPWPLPKHLDEQAPTHITLPTGSRVAVDYSEYPPVLAVKLQEMFGQRQTPCIANGRLGLTLHLLSPAGRPLQVTQDLESFWRNAYTDVKKDMKGRYPKHPWPDDPLSAVPKRGTKKQGY